MFRKKNKKKLDPRVRYQHQSFTKKLDQARHYKRDKAPVSENRTANFLAKLGLKTALSQTAVIVILGGLAYLIFVPNFLSPKTIEIRGADGDAANQVKSAVQSYLNNAPFYLAQHNLIFLSAGRLKTSLLSDPQVYKIGSIAKSFFRRKLTVTLELKSPRYLVNRNNVTYSVYNDGTIQEQLPGDPAQWLSTNPGAVKIKDQAIAPPLQAGAKYLSDDLMARIAELQDRFKPVTNNEIDYFAIPTFVTAAPAPQDLAATSTSAIIPELSLPEQALPLRPADLYVYAKKQTTKKGGVPDFKVIFDLNSDLGSALSKLQLLFSQMPPDRYAKLVYVDVRFDNRAFLCLSGTPCVDSANPAPFSGTIIPAPASPAAPTATSTNLKGQ